jgi:hypothetical protein
LIPLVFDRDGLPMVAVFSDAARLGALAETAPYLLTMTGGAFLSRVQPGIGVVINPHDLELGLELFPDGIAHLVESCAE